METRENRIALSKKPVKCPMCGGKNIRDIVYHHKSLPEQYSTIEEAPKWECTDCGKTFHLYDKNAIIKKCKYYKGEDTNPYTERNAADGGLALRQIWEYEFAWACLNQNATDKLDKYVNHYIKAGLQDFNKDDGTPMSLKALLYNRFEHWQCDYDIASNIEGFKVWYADNY